MLSLAMRCLRNGVSCLLTQQFRSFHVELQVLSPIAEVLQGDGRGPQEDATQRQAAGGLVQDQRGLLETTSIRGMVKL